MTDRLHVATTDGKYTVIQAEEGGMRFLRHGEPWEAADADFAHVGLILALAQEVQGLRDILARARMVLPGEAFAAAFGEEGKV